MSKSTWISDDTTCDKCGGTDWIKQQYMRLSDPPLYGYNCKGCQKEQLFSHCHQKDGLELHKHENEIMILQSPKLDEIRADPVAWRKLLDKLSIAHVDIYNHSCDGCGKTTQEATHLHIMMDYVRPVEIIAVMHWQEDGEGMKFVRETIDGKELVLDMCSNGYKCRDKYLQSNYSILIGEESAFDTNNTATSQLNTHG